VLASQQKIVRAVEQQEGKVEQKIVEAVKHKVGAVEQQIVRAIEQQVGKIELSVAEAIEQKIVEAVERKIMPPGGGGPHPSEPPDPPQTPQMCIEMSAKPAWVSSKSPDVYIMFT